MKSEGEKRIKERKMQRERKVDLLKGPTGVTVFGFGVSASPVSTATANHQFSAAAMIMTSYATSSHLAAASTFSHPTLLSLLSLSISHQRGRFLVEEPRPAYPAAESKSGFNN